MRLSSKTAVDAQCVIGDLHFAYLTPETSGLPASLPVWFEPRAGGRTPMCQALQAAHDVTSNFIAQYPGCFTPIVINITDGIATNGDPEPVAAGLSGLTSQDGNVLLMNIHISPEGSSPILLPASDAELTDDYARRLFRMSSPLPGEMLENAHTLDSSVGVGARGLPLTQT